MQNIRKIKAEYKKDICPQCNGTGKKDNKECSKCAGTGHDNSMERAIEWMDKKLGGSYNVENEPVVIAEEICKKIMKLIKKYDEKLQNNILKEIESRLNYLRVY